MLDQGARAYVNHSRGAEFIRGELYVSTIYNWFIEDFGGDTRGVIAHLSRYAEPTLKKRLSTVSDIAGNRYDWGLNLYRKPEYGFSDGSTAALGVKAKRPSHKGHAFSAIRRKSRPDDGLRIFAMMSSGEGCRYNRSPP